MGIHLIVMSVFCVEIVICFLFLLLLEKWFDFSRESSKRSEGMKYVLVTGGVVSGLGKGVTVTGIGLLLQVCDLYVTSFKIGFCLFELYPVIGGVIIFPPKSN